MVRIKWRRCRRGWRTRPTVAWRWRTPRSFASPLWPPPPPPPAPRSPRRQGSAPDDRSWKRARCPHLSLSARAHVLFLHKVEVGGSASCWSPTSEAFLAASGARRVGHDLWLRSVADLRSLVPMSHYDEASEHATAHQRKCGGLLPNRHVTGQVLRRGGQNRSGRVIDATTFVQLPSYQVSTTSVFGPSDSTLKGYDTIAIRHSDES